MALVLSCLPAIADDEQGLGTYKFVVPPGSPFVPLAESSGPAGAPTGQSYSGQLLISGTFRAAWGLIGGIPSHIRLKFYPDQASKAFLPYEEDSFEDVTTKHPVKELSFLNEEQALANLVPKNLYRHLKDKRLKTVSGTATVSIEGYATNVDCDRRWYATTFVAVTKSSVRAVSKTTSQTGVCQ
ncbi:MAG: hypothetical protein E6Q78_00410 [Rhodoferax sp.]|nr:MAG: hypothetical protein E6Q78_00410 [Rhodoferax sp.]